MKKFVTLYWQAENVELVKDNGQIPYQMQKLFGYESQLVCNKSPNGYPYLDSEAKGLELKFLKQWGRPFFWENGALYYLWKNAKSIDVFNLYFLVQESMLYGLIYKHLNPDGILYLKLDMDILYYKKNMIRFSDVPWKEKFHQKMYPLFLEKCDIISVESNSAHQYLAQLDKKLYRKTMVLPNGTNREKIMSDVGFPDYAEKENLILTVGRIGTRQKNNELLLKALNKVDLTGWKVKFVGPVEDSFKPEIASFFKKNTGKKNHIEFTGNISDRTELMQLYKKSKIFCLTSRWEGFSIALVEALVMGNHVISTDSVSSIREITDNGKYGQVIDLSSVSQLSNALKQAMEKGFYNKSYSSKIIEYGRKYDWAKILKKLDSSIRTIEKGNA